MPNSFNSSHKIVGNRIYTLESARLLVSHVVRIVKLSAFAIWMGYCLQSCQKDELSKLKSSTSVVLSATETNQLQREFAKSLAQTISSEPEVREFLKDEALLQFDGDDDILYYAIKDKPINGKLTLRQHLAKYLGSDALSAIELKSPLLTIFVPSLPGGFSPTTWDTQGQIPAVAVCQRNSNVIPLFSGSGLETEVPAGHIPGFPTLVIKQNERVIALEKSVVTTHDNSLNFHQDETFVFWFGDVIFDNIHRKASDAKPANEHSANVAGRFLNAHFVDQKVIDAYNLNGTNPNVQWQRDYIYYGISPTNTSGPLDRNYTEYIGSLTFSSDALNVMSDQTEDVGNSSDTAPTWVASNPWTEGRFEIRISVLINSKNGVGNEYKRLISVRGEDLYFATYNQSNSYFVGSYVPLAFACNIPIVPWDLDSYGNAWKFVFYEQDLSGTSSYTASNSTTYAANFSVSASGGTVVKLSSQFGGSVSTTSSSSFTVTRNVGDDFLGEAILTFDRPVLLSYTKRFPNTYGYSTNEITTGGQYGYVSASIEPGRY